MIKEISLTCFKLINRKPQYEKIIFFIVCIMCTSIIKASEIDLIKHRIAEWHWEKGVDKAATVLNAQNGKRHYRVTNNGKMWIMLTRLLMYGKALSI